MYEWRGLGMSNNSSKGGDKGIYFSKKVMQHGIDTILSYTTTGCEDDVCDNGA